MVIRRKCEQSILDGIGNRSWISPRQDWYVRFDNADSFSKEIDFLRNIKAYKLFFLTPIVDSLDLSLGSYT